MFGRRCLKVWKYAALGLFLALGIVACRSFSFPASTQPLAAVEALPPPALPDWIEQISPTGEAEPLAQIRIRFQQPLIPVESLEGADSQTKLDYFEIAPALPGRFRFLTPRLVGFQADQALPKATRIKVTLKAGLADLDRHQLSEDLAWTFNTELLKLTHLPGAAADPNASTEPIDLQPTLEVTSNVELDLNSLRQHLALIPKDKQPIPMQVALKETPENQPERPDRPQETFNPALRDWVYSLTAQRPLAKATPYRLEFSPGLRPAHGNLPSQTAFVGQVTTYAPLAFKSLELVGKPDAGGTPGRFVKGSPQLTFNNGLDVTSISDRVSLAPPPKPGVPLVQGFEGEPLINLNPWALEPATLYTITLDAQLTDKFGQRLGKPVTLQYNTGDLAADFWAPSDLHIFPTGKPLQLNFSAVNLPESEYRAAYRVVQPTDLVYSDSAYPRGEGLDWLPPVDQWSAVAVRATKNQPIELTVPLQEKLGGATGLLAYGVQARTNRYAIEETKPLQWREPRFYGLVQLTNLGVFTQWFPEAGLVRVHHLSDGTAVNAAQVEVYESRLEAESRPMPRPCATGTTDRTGTFTLSAGALRACNGDRSLVDPPKLLTVVREGADWTFARSLEWSGSYGYGISAGWEGQPVSRGTIFSDRQLYQPGETAHFTAVAAYLHRGGLQLDKDAVYSVAIEAPSGSKTELPRQTTSAFGSFSLEWPLPADLPLGYYTIRARSQNGVEIRGEFRVAEFKPPNFNVELALDKPIAQIGETVTAQAQSHYLFGPAVQGGTVDYYVTREKVDFVPPDWQSYAFGRQWFWPEAEPIVPADVLQVNTSLDAEGKGRQTVTVAEDLPYAMSYRVDAQVTDVSNLSVAASQTFTALPSDRLIGLKSEFVATAGQPFNLSLVVTNPQGEPIANQRVRVELQQMIVSSVTQVIEGSQTARDQVEYKTVAQLELRSGQMPETVALTAPDSGAYRIRANFAEATSDRSASDTQIWVTGAATVNWGAQENQHRLELQLDRKTYKPGDMATVLIQSPYPEAELYFAVVRHQPLYQTTRIVRGGAPQIQFQVTAEMLPNAAVEAVLVRRGEPIAQLEPGGLENLVRIGFAPFAIDVANQYLQIEQTLRSPTVQPGAEQTVDLKLTTAENQPVQGQVTIMVVNESVLQLTHYRPPDLVKTVYAEQAISTRFADNRPDVVLEPLASPIEKGWGFGGGLSAGVGNTRIRRNFQPIAYYKGAVLTDAGGRASVSFTLPDDLTTWRVMAVASDGQLHFGQAETTFITSQALVTQPLLPQFARAGDRFDVGLTVTNSTDTPQRLTINGAIAGSLTLEKATSLPFQTQIDAGTSAYRFAAIANQPGAATVQFAAQLNGDSDALEVPLEVTPLELTEQVVESGTTDRQVTIPVRIDPNVAAAELELTLASTLIGELQAPAQQVLQEEQLPFLEPAASQLAIAATLQQLSQISGPIERFNPVQQAAEALERLRSLQRPDGGFASIPGQEQADPFGSPYAAQSLAIAQAANLPVDVELIARLKSYLQKLLADPGQYEFCQEQPCKDQLRLEALLALAALGDQRSDFLSDLYARHRQFAPLMQIKLARYLSQFPDWQPEATELAHELQERVYETGRSAALNLPQSWLSSATAAQAQTLRLFVARQRAGQQTGISSSEGVARLVQSLLDLRRQGSWGSTYDNAEALTALVDYSQLQPTPPSFRATAQLAAKPVAAAEFQGYRPASVGVTLPIADLPQGTQPLTLTKLGPGTLHYLAAYRYRLQGNPAGRFNGIRVTRSIRAANQTQVLASMGLHAIDRPVTVQAGQVFDIGLEVIVDHPVDHLVITDPLPAGFEAVDTQFQTATPYFQAASDSWEIGYQTIHRDRIVAYGDHLEAGVYTFHYLVRSVTAGQFLYPGAEAHLQYAPEEFGRSAAAALTVTN